MRCTVEANYFRCYKRLGPIAKLATSYIGEGFPIDTGGLHALGKECAQLRGFAGHLAHDCSGFVGAPIRAGQQDVKGQCGHACRNACGLVPPDGAQGRIGRVKDRSDVVLALSMKYEIDQIPPD